MISCFVSQSCLFPFHILFTSPETWALLSSFSLHIFSEAWSVVIHCYSLGALTATTETKELALSSTSTPPQGATGDKWRRKLWAAMSGSKVINDRGSSGTECHNRSWWLEGFFQNKIIFQERKIVLHSRKGIKLEMLTTALQRKLHVSIKVMIQ